MSEKNELEVWLDHAEDDFNAIQKLMRGKKPSIYGACFHAQQCAEKYMKAMLVKCGKRFPMIHDLPTINNLMQQAGIEMQIPENDLALLSSYVIRARYAEERPEMEDAKEALKIAKTVRKFARSWFGLK
jgi:HEPN domain-containing protein